MPSLSKVIKSQQIAANYSERCLSRCAVLEEAPSAAAESSPHDDLHPLSRHSSDYMAEAEHKAAEILANAKQRREEIMKETEANAVAIEERAHKEGYDKGYIEGLAAGRREADELICQAREELSAAHKQRAEMLKQVEPQVVALAVSVAEKMIGERLAATPELVLLSVKEGLSKLSEQGEIIVRLHPADMSICKEHQGSLQSELRESSTLSFVPDDTLEKGSCRIEAGSAVVECLLGERLMELRKMLAEADRDE